MPSLLPPGKRALRWVEPVGVVRDRPRVGRQQTRVGRLDRLRPALGDGEDPVLTFGRQVHPERVTTNALTDTASGCDECGGE